jgi:hypothetical protein
MKKLFALIALFACMTGYSQDEITKQDGSVIKVKVTDILDGVIKYKKFENLDGPTYNLETSKIKQVKYANGSIDTFEAAAPVKAVSSETEKPAVQEKPKKLLDDPNFKRQVEAIAKDAGEQVIESCSGSTDNSGTDIYWDGVFKNMDTGDLTVPIRAWWNKKWSPDGNKKSIRGKVIVRKSGEKQWIYQSSEGLNFTGCAEKLSLK